MPGIARHHRALIDYQVLCTMEYATVCHLNNTNPSTTQKAAHAPAKAYTTCKLCASNVRWEFIIRTHANQTRPTAQVRNRTFKRPWAGDMVAKYSHPDCGDLLKQGRNDCIDCGYLCYAPCNTYGTLISNPQNRSRPEPQVGVGPRQHGLGRARLWVQPFQL